MSSLLDLDYRAFHAVSAGLAEEDASIGLLTS
jgi:hypothetical protein